MQGSDHVHLQPWSLSESPSSSLNPKTQKWMRKRWKEAWSSNWTSSAPQEGCGCPPAVSQGPGGHPNCTTPALVQLPRPIPPATEEPASPDSWEQEQFIRDGGRGGCWGQQGGSMGGRRGGNELGAQRMSPKKARKYLHIVYK